MSKININTYALKEQFTPTLNTGINELNKAINALDSLDIPNGFSYNSYLKKINKIINEDINECLKVKEMIINSTNNFNNAEQNIINLFSNNKRT